MKYRFLALAAGLIAVSTFAATPDSITISTTFDRDPLQQGWKVFGNTNLFAWDANNRALNVTWDSTSVNSYFYCPIGTVLNRKDDFKMEFDLTLTDLTGQFEIALGFINVASATGPNFLRGTGSDSPNLAEFDYFPPGDFWSGSITPVIGATNNWNTKYNSPFCSGFIEQTLPFGTPIHVSYAYTATNLTVSLTLQTANESLGSTSFALAPEFTDFRCDAFSINCYNDKTPWGGSVLAHGVVQNINLTVPPAPIQNLRCGLKQGTWAATFDSRANWRYTLEKSSDLANWTPAADPFDGTGAQCALQDQDAPAKAQFYRVRAQRPD